MCYSVNLKDTYSCISCLGLVSEKGLCIWMCWLCIKIVINILIFFYNKRIIIIFHHIVFGNRMGNMRIGVAPCCPYMDLLMLLIKTWFLVLISCRSWYYSPNYRVLNIWRIIYMIFFNGFCAGCDGHVETIHTGP